MKVTEKKVRAIVFHGMNYIKKWIFLWSGNNPLFFPKPQIIYMTPDMRCNSRCLMCHAWKTCEKPLSFLYWKRIIDDIVSFLGPYTKVNISGGEIFYSPLMKKIIAYAIERLPYTGITSNGLLITKHLAKELIAKNFSNINISIDGNTEKTVNSVRGRNDAFERSRNAVRYLVYEKKKQHRETKIIVKAIFMGMTMKELPDLASWVHYVGADGIYIQPIQPLYYTNSSVDIKKTMLWPHVSQKEIVKSVICRLIQMKKEGFPIMNDEESLREMYVYFGMAHKEQQQTVQKKSCTIDLTTLFIFSEGTVHFCGSFPPIGTIQKDSLRTMLYSSIAQLQRIQIRNCKKLCLETCRSNKSIFEMAKKFFWLNT